MSVYRCDDCGTEISVDVGVRKVFCSNCGKKLYDVTEIESPSAAPVQSLEDFGSINTENEVIADNSVYANSNVVLADVSEQTVSNAEESNSVFGSAEDQVMVFDIEDSVTDAALNDDFAATEENCVPEIVLPALNGIPAVQENVQEYNQQQADNIFDKKNRKKEWLIAAIIAIVILLIAVIVAISFSKSENAPKEPVTEIDETINLTTESNSTNGAFYVYFECNNGEKLIENYMPKRGLIPEPNVPTRDGYAFAGWYSDAEFTNSWDFNTDIASGEMTIYAKWIEEISQDEIEGVGDNSNNAVDNSPSNKEILFLKDIAGLPFDTAKLKGFSWYYTYMYSTSYERETVINVTGEGWRNGNNGPYAYPDDYIEIIISAGPIGDSDFYDSGGIDLMGPEGEMVPIGEMRYYVTEGTYDEKTEEEHLGEKVGPFTWEELQAKYGDVLGDYAESEFSSVSSWSLCDSDNKLTVIESEVKYRYTYEVYD